MYLWNINELVTALKEDKLSKKQVGLYYVLTPLLTFANFIFFSFLLAGHHFVSQIFAHFLSGYDAHMSFYNKIALFTTALTIFFTLAGIYLCYQINQAGDKKDFSKRMTCLTFPINFHLTVYTLAFLALTIFISYFIFNHKIIHFKEAVFKAIGSQGKQSDGLQTAKKALDYFLGEDTSKESILGNLFKTPGKILTMPLVPARIKTFFTLARTTVLQIYPLLSCIPPLLSFSQYMTLRHYLKKIAQ